MNIRTNIDIDIDIDIDNYIDVVYYYIPSSLDGL